MRDFGKWLGKDKGKDMLIDVCCVGSLEQVRAAVTTYCVIFDIEVDTKEWDELVDWLDISYNPEFEFFKDKDKLDRYMSALLV